MDSANKQTAVVAEVTQGTTPTSPAFKLLRDNRVSGSPSRSNNRSPERRSDRTAANMYTSLNTFPKQIDMTWARDAGTDILLESVLCGAWASDVLKNGSTKKPFTLEEKYEGGATDPFRRLAGCLVDTLSIGWRLGEPGSMSFGIKGLAESVATTALGSSTYAVPTPYYDPVTPTDIVVTDLFSLTTPKVVGLQLSISNGMREQHAFGSASPFGIGLGMFDVSGSAQVYLSAAADYSTFMTRQPGLALEITIGSVADFKDTIVIPNLDVWNPDIDDPGQSGDHLVTLQFLGRYHADGVINITRLVA